MILVKYVCVSSIRGNTGIMYKDLTLLWAAK